MRVRFHQLLCCWFPCVQNDPFDGGALTLKKKTISLGNGLGCAPLLCPSLPDHSQAACSAQLMAVSSAAVPVQAAAQHGGGHCSTTEDRAEELGVGAALRESSSPHYKPPASSSQGRKILPKLWERSQLHSPPLIKGRLKLQGRALQHFSGTKCPYHPWLCQDV